MGSVGSMSLASYISATRWWHRLGQLLHVLESSSSRPRHLHLRPSAISVHWSAGEDLSRDVIARSDNVVAFPLGNRTALARLASELNARVVATQSGFDTRGQADPILLAVTAGYSPRLVIDSTSHVEHAEDRSLFRVVLGGESDARVSLETSNYDKVKQFVWEYLQATRVPDPKAGTGR